MKTIYINGLMPERSQILFKHLADNFHIIGNGLDALKSNPSLKVSNPFEITGAMMGEDHNRLQNDINRNVKVLEESLQNDIQALGFQTAKIDSQNSLRPKVTQLLKQAAYFRLLHKKHPIDLVLSGADYGSHARSIVRAARDLGIVTMNLEHGFFFNQIRWEFSEVKGHMPMFFTSEFVNLDSPMEVELFEELLENFPDQGTKFLGLGTPVDTVAGNVGTRNESCLKLGIDPDKTVISMMGRWIEARSLNNLVRGQLNTINLFESLFAELAKNDFKNNLEFLIKLHPAEARPEVFANITSCLENMARKFNLTPPRIFGDQLPDVLNASDLVGGIGFSSVLFDAFQLGKPTLVWTPPFLVPSPKPEWTQKGNIPLSANVMKVVQNSGDFWNEAEQWLQPEGKIQLAEDIKTLTKKYQLQYVSVEEKSQNIVQWIHEQLA